MNLSWCHKVSLGVSFWLDTQPAKFQNIMDLNTCTSHVFTKEQNKNIRLDLRSLRIILLAPWKRQVYHHCCPQPMHRGKYSTISLAYASLRQNSQTSQSPSVNPDMPIVHEIRRTKGPTLVTYYIATCPWFFHKIMFSPF